MSYKIVKADIAGKGTFYRLQVGSFQNRNMAAALCKKLKAKKQDCIPAK
jgi:cell division septation protein DedD